MHQIRTVLRAPAGEAPEGGSGASAQPAPSTVQTTPTPAPAVTPAQPAVSKIDPSDPELRKLIAAATKKAGEEAAAAERAKIEEEQRLAKLDVESRAKAEKKKAEDEATAARAEAEKHKAEAAFARGLLSAGLVPQTELAESMALAAVRELVGQGIVWADAVARVGKEHAYLFKGPAPAAPAATVTQPAAAPGTVLAARTRTTGGVEQPAGTAAIVEEDAYRMSPEQWQQVQRDIAAGRRP